MAKKKNSNKKVAQKKLTLKEQIAKLLKILMK